MKLGIKKSTSEEVEEMRRLYRTGLSLSEIGRRFGRDHTTIFYWIKKKGDYDPNRKVIRTNAPTENKKSTIKIEEPKIEKPEVITKPEIKKSLPETRSLPINKTNLCIKCGKEKNDPRWIMTEYCSLKCWHEYHFPLKNYSY